MEKKTATAWTKRVHIFSLHTNTKLSQWSQLSRDLDTTLAPQFFKKHVR